MKTTVTITGYNPKSGSSNSSVKMETQGSKTPRELIPLMYGQFRIKEHEILFPYTTVTITKYTIKIAFGKDGRQSISLKNVHNFEGQKQAFKQQEPRRKR